MTKIIPITGFIKHAPLSPLMIKTLRAACKKQNNKEAFGQKDLDGSFIALLKREFIASKTIILPNGYKEVLWFVTTAGREMLRKLGFKEAC
ncbi:MAG: hypothetical protein ABIO76_03000 [Ginsengibacter sp.]